MPSELACPRVLLIGCGPTTLSALDSLAEMTAVVGVVRDACEDDPVRRRAAGLGVPVNDKTTVADIATLVNRLRPDAVVVSSYSRILPARLVEQTKFVNVHYALLPRYRGRANVNWAIINGESETGITIHALVPDLDAGNILFQQAVAIRQTDTVTTLYANLNAIQREHLGEVVIRHLNGDPGRTQSEVEASYGCTRLPRDGEIDWSQPARRVHDLIRALTPPYPGAFTYFNGIPLRIWRAEPSHAPPRYDGRVSGRVVRVSKSEGWVEVLTGDGVLRVFEAQLADGPRQPAANVLGSVKYTVGLSMGDLIGRVQALESAVARHWAETERLTASGR